MNNFCVPYGALSAYLQQAGELAVLESHLWAPFAKNQEDYRNGIAYGFEMALKWAEQNKVLWEFPKQIPPELFSD